MNRYAKLRVRQRVLAYISASACLALVACFPLPVRFPTRTTDPTSQKIDLTFLKPGSTTRDEVTRKLTSVDTGTKEDFFWGRVRVSKYRTIVMVGYVPIGPGDRMWGAENLLISYDPKGVVKRSVIVSDTHLLPQLDILDAAAVVPFALTSPVSVGSVEYWTHVKHQPRAAATTPLTLAAGSLECFDVRIARNDLRRISLKNSGGLFGPESDVDRIRLALFFSRQIDFSKTPLRKRTDHLDVNVDPPMLLILYRYVKQTALNPNGVRNRDAEIQHAATSATGGPP